MFEAEYKRMMDGIAPTQELIADTLKKAQAEQGKRPARRVKGSLILASVLILGLIGATAIALTPPKLVNWSGDKVPGFSQDVGSMTKEAKANREFIEEMIRQKPENEMWWVESPTHGGTTSYPSKFFESLEEMLQYIKEADDSIFVPCSIPSGYQFDKGNVVFFASIKTLLRGIGQLPTETLSDGTTIRKWKAPDTYKKDISFYHIGLKSDDGGILDIYFRREEAEDPDNTSFYVQEGGGSETLSIDGMESALYVNIPSSRYNHALHILQASATQREWYDWPMYDNPDPGLNMPVDYEGKRTYAYANYSICSTALDKDQLLKMAENLR